MGARLGRLLLVCAMGAAAPALAQDAARQDPLVGTWLVEPEAYDAWVDAGYDVPWYPLLAIRADGSFTLFRLAPSCAPPYAPDGTIVSADQEAQRHAALCLEAAERARRDGFEAGHLHLSAAGRWSLGSDGRVTFASATRGPTPEFLRETLPRLRAKVETDLRDTGLSDRERRALNALLVFATTHERRLASFYGSFYVFDDAPAAVALDAGRLRLTAAGADAAFVFRAYRPELLDGAMAITALIGVSAAEYFRCVLARVEAGWPPAGPRDDHGRLAQAARDLMPAAARLELAFILRRAEHEAEAARLVPEAEQAKTEARQAELERHPAAEAAAERRFGAWFGCPDRDRP
jgi:hypothetical protein